jgi:outer membrane murein-binding lipoprotein Lpp
LALTQKLPELARQVRELASEVERLRGLLNKRQGG